jgi:hypothetical protein
LANAMPGLEPDTAPGPTQAASIPEWVELDATRNRSLTWHGSKSGGRWMNSKRPDGWCTRGPSGRTAGIALSLGQELNAELERGRSSPKGLARAEREIQLEPRARRELTRLRN